MLWISYLWFHQGGGWNQNSRFDQVRAMVEAGRLDINDHMTYVRVPGDEDRVRLFPRGPQAQLERGTPRPNSFDLAWVNRRFFPNKPPGISYLAAPGYALLAGAARLFGADREHWWTLTLIAHLTSGLSVGLMGAVAGAVFPLVSRRVFPAARPWTHVAAALTFGLGTMMWPFGTVLFDHVPVAAFLLIAYALILADANPADAGAVSPLRLVAAGLACGAAVVTNYAAILIVVPLMARAALPGRSFLRLGWIAVGGAAPALLLAWYHQACFGAVFTIANTYQAEAFKSKDAALLGVFNLPDPIVFFKLLFSPYRGLFITSPVLLLCGYGWWRMARDWRTLADALLGIAAFGVFLLMNAAFNGWHGGYSAGPRYLVPALPFACLALTPCFDRLPKVTTALAAASVALMLLASAVDAQWPQHELNPLSRYVLPLLRGEVIIDKKTEVVGPVSVNTVGIYENGFQRLYPADSVQGRWSAYNIGEWLAPRSVLSIVPLLLLQCGLGIVLFRRGGAPSHSA